MHHMDIAEIAGAAGGGAVVYVAGYFQAFREQPMLSNPQGVDTVMFFFARNARLCRCNRGLPQENGGLIESQAE